MQFVKCLRSVFSREFCEISRIDFLQKKLCTVASKSLCSEIHDFYSGIDWKSGSTFTAYPFHVLFPDEGPIGETVHNEPSSL